MKSIKPRGVVKALANRAYCRAAGVTDACLRLFAQKRFAFSD